MVFLSLLFNSYHHWNAATSFVSASSLPPTRICFYHLPRRPGQCQERIEHNFVRKAKEPIRTAMTRFSCLVDKIRCLSNPTSWMDIKYKMTKSVLKQVITIKTRQFIDYEEQKIKKVGGQFDMKELIELV